MKKSYTFVFTIFLLISSLFSENSSFDEKAILIVSDKDGLEWNVADYLETYFSEDGFKVSNILLEDFTKKESVTHKVVIMLSVIKHDKIPSNIRVKLPQEESLTKDKKRDEHETIFFISTITGDEWKSGQRMIDGVTSASEMDDAEPIAKRIIEKVKEKLTTIHNDSK